MNATQVHPYLDESTLRQRFGTAVERWFLRQTTPAAAIDCGRELFTGAVAKDRPDGLVILDDHLVRGISVGLLLAGVKAPEQVEVVAHANFPLPQRAFVPCSYLGFDAREIIQTCVQRIQDQRQGKPVPRITRMDSKWESQVRPCSGQDSPNLLPTLAN